MNFLDLTPTEFKFYNCLEKTISNSYWGHGIRTVVNNPDATVEDFKELVKELKVAADDDGGILLDVLGEDCFDALVTM